MQTAQTMKPQTKAIEKYQDSIPSFSEDNKIDCTNDQLEDLDIKDKYIHEQLKEKFPNVISQDKTENVLPESTRK